MPVCQKEVTVRNNIWNNVCLIILPVKEKSAYAFLIFFYHCTHSTQLLYMKSNITFHNDSIDIEFLSILQIIVTFP